MRSSRSATASRATLDALGYEPHESWTNFVLFGGVDDPAATWQALYDRGVLIRDVGIPHHLRVTAGTEAGDDRVPRRARLDRLGAHEPLRRTRPASLRRATSESTVELELDLDGSGRSHIDTTVPFFDHLLTAFAKHSLTDLTVRASGDTDIDAHHTVEDVAIVLGQAIREALGDKAGISRYGDALVPLDEALAQAVVDISGRPYLVHTGEPAGFEHHLIGGHFTGSLVRHTFEAIAFNGGAHRARHACSPVATRTTSPRPSTRRSRARSGRRRRSTRSSRASRARRALCDRQPARRGARLRVGQRPLRGQGARRRGRRREADRRPRRSSLEADGLVVPGVGAFRAVMEALRASRGDELIDRRLAGGRPVLGICVGMQVLFERGVERGVDTEGLGEWPGVVTELDAPVLPHMGWNTVEPGEGSRLFRGIEDERFYFVHSFARAAVAAGRAAAVPAAGADVVRLRRSRSSPRSRTARSSATQFHPEKSGDAGIRLLSNWIDGLGRATL